MFLHSPFCRHLPPVRLLSRLQGLNANSQNGEYSQGGHICCGNVNLKYDNEISGSQCIRPAPTMKRVMTCCYDRWRAWREGWSDVFQWLAMALHPLGPWYGFSFLFKAGLIWSTWLVSLISWHLEAPFGGRQDRQLMCCFSGISVPLLFGRGQQDSW